MRFEEQVWDLMKLIPKGRVTTYKIIAEMLNTKAYRAVGNACRRNPNAPIIPCHRVVKSDGKIGGFGGKTSGSNITQKIRLLEEEGIKVENSQIVNFKKVLFRY
jgi:methylated-DNA-[protein]-cysteine S-methyltransferase